MVKIIPPLNEQKKVFVERPTFLKRALNFKNFLIFITLGFAALTYLAKQHNYFNTDLRITLFIQQFNFVWFDFLMRFLSFVGDGVPLITMVILLVIYGYLIGKRKAPFMLVISTIGGLLLSQLLKIIVSRPRPDPTLINQIGQYIRLDSFPSGHVLGAMSFYGFLLYIAYTQLKKGWFRNMVMVVCIFMVSLMGLSRIYLGAHWFSDVLGAYLIGFVWLSLMIFTYHKLKPKVKPE